MPLTPDLSWTGLEEFVNKYVVENNKVMSSEEEHKGRSKSVMAWVPKETDVSYLWWQRIPQMDLQDQGVIDSGCSRHMTGNMSYLTDYEEIDGGYVAFEETQIPRKNNMYSFDLKNIVLKGGLTCLFAKATSDESKLWRRRLGHLNFKTMNKLVKGNLVRGLPSKLFENESTCVCLSKGKKQHKTASKSKTKNSINLSLHLLHMDLFGPIFVKSHMKKMYYLVVTNDCGRFTWVFFLATKDETSGILKSFITGIENLVDHKVKVIRCDNETEFKNREINQFCEMNVIGDLQLAIQTKRMSKNLEEHGFFSTIQQRTNHKDLASTPMENQKPLFKDEDGKEVDVHMYRLKSIIGVSHLHAVKGFLGKAKKSVKLIMEKLFRMELELIEAIIGVGDSLVRAATTASSLEAKSRTHRLKRLYKVGLTARVESSDNEESLGEDASKQGRIDAIDADEEITLVSVHDVNVSAGEEVFATTVDDITLAQVLEEMKSTKPKKKGVVIQELGESTTTISSQLSSQQSQDKAEFDEEERLAREKAEKEEEANIALIETWDDIQAKIDDDHQLAKRMQAQEQEELSIEEKATLFQQLLEKRRKHFAAKRAEEKRNKPPTKAQ
ncbi:putative ribonuclease H-like domain-containing protein [Tanacetum coccineum]